MDDLSGLEFTAQLPCEATGGCVWKLPAQYILRRPCCDETLTLCQRHADNTQALLWAHTWLRCNNPPCKRLVLTRKCTVEEIFAANA